MHLGAQAAFTAISFTTLSGLTLLLRCAARLVVVKNAGKDDILAICAFLASLITTVTIYIQYQHGLGQDVWKLESSEIGTMLKATYISIIAYGASMTFLKASALCQYLRFIFDRKPRILCWTLLVLCSVYGIAGFFVSTFTCRPRSGAVSGQDNECIHLVPYWYTTSTWTIITDIIIVAIPIVAVRKLNMPRAQRRALIVVFAMGGCGCIASVVRMYFVYVSASSTNTTRDIANAALWSAIEADIGIICISLPPLKSLAVIVFPRLANRSIEQRSDLSTTLASSMATDTIMSDLQKGSSTSKQEVEPYTIP